MSDRILVYATGGVAFGGVDGSGDLTINCTLCGIGAAAAVAPQSLSIAASDRKTHVGWTAGAGIEGMITSNWSARLEYLYTDLGWLKHEGPRTVAAR